MIFEDTDTIGVAFADEGLYEVAHFLERPRHESYRSEGSNTANSMYGGLSFDGALRVAQDGWHEGVGLVHELLAGLPIMENATGVANWKRDVCGSIPDVPRFLSGEPTYMLRHARQEGSSPVIHIVVNTALVAGSTANQQTNYGAGLCGLIDWLEAKGKRIELDRLGVVDDGRRRSFQGWKIKRAADNLDLAATVFALAHLASHRHLVWGMRERMIHLHWRPVRVTQADAHRIGAEGALIVDSVLSDGAQCNTVAGACLLAARRLNHAAGDDICDIEELTRALTGVAL
jgi:hypothetical protein